MKAAGFLLLALAAALGVVLVREETMSRHTAVAAHTELHVVIDASSNLRDAPLVDMVQALFLLCELEVGGGPAAPVRHLGAGSYLLRLRPSLDRSDRLQFTGCLEDAHVDRLQTGVRSVRHVDASPPPSPLPG